jgi:regulator of sigma D
LERRKEYLAAISRNLQTRFQICTKEICRLSNESINWLLGYCLKQAEKNKKMGQESEILKRFLQRLQTFCSMSHSLPVTNITHKVEVSSHNFDDAKEKDKNSPNLKDSTVNEKHPFKETQTQSSTASEHTLASVSSPSLHLQSSGERPAKRKANHSQYLRKRKELISPLESKISNKEKRQRAVESFQQFTTEVAEFLLSFLQYVINLFVSMSVLHLRETNVFSGSIYVRCTRLRCGKCSSATRKIFQNVLIQAFAPI